MWPTAVTGKADQELILLASTCLRSTVISGHNRNIKFCRFHLVMASHLNGNCLFCTHPLLHLFFFTSRAAAESYDGVGGGGDDVLLFCACKAF